ncbi:MAG: GNAT family N-acetyltransferase [Anaerolineales bacterium]|nr:GNAT family N-acetyltransferase [Anaerolineales bacterium]
MKYTIHNLHEIAPELLPKLAEIHMGDHGLLSELGYPFVERYFEIVYKNKQVVAVYAQNDETGELIGYNIAAPEPAALTGQLTSDRAWFIKQIIKAAFTRPLAIVQLVVSSLTIRTQMQNEADAIESLYLTINPNYRGMGMGGTLQRGLFEAVRAAGYKRIVGSVEISNQASLKMCLSNGFTITKTFREGKYTRHRIEKIL